MRGRLGRTACALTLLVLAPLLASCAAEQAGPGLGSSRAALDALRSLGVDCKDFSVDEIAAVPFTQIRCAGLGIDWFADAATYRAAVAADCAAVPADRRGGLAGIAIVTGPDWVIRGNGAGDINAWPDTVGPASAAQRLDGTLTTEADYCRSLDAWK